MVPPLNNPYAARGVTYKPWVAVDHYAGSRIVHGRYAWRWLARLASVGVLRVERNA